MTPDDEVLVGRLRQQLKGRRGVSEQRMFGGLCFMVNGNMCVGPWQGSLVVRLDKADHEATQAEPHAGPMNITGKTMRGWALVAPAGIAEDADLARWVGRAVEFVRTLPAK
ncbi:hypothetical protein Pla123a_20860 [Posidoniimonas polymericola]|uniref:TfoX N-terminal domain-containing protein n=1 Tax=Posidoniimonas polymericola TaxID=2528002 RepID=A0A5C5YRB8_9BACT|nr:TfoX/Sxy family protein [Posidoniimonas polymericola]TWT77425.1 hypothetical protein Pla123a_20860 [Posidoniimonas polymericola]